MGEGHWESYALIDGLPNVNVAAILEDREGYLWFGTEEGVSRYDGDSFATLNVEDGLAGNRVICILEDRDGNLWFGTGRCTWELRINRLHYNTAIYSAEVDSPALPWLKEL